MDRRTSQATTAPTEPSDDTAIAAAVADVATRHWDGLWVALDAVTVEASHVTWAGGGAVDTVVVDGVERPVIQTRYPVYSGPMERLLHLIDELGLVVPFNWTEWDGFERYRAGAGLADAPVAEAVRMITAIVRSEHFCDGAIDGAWQDGTLPAALERLRAHTSQGRARRAEDEPGGDRLKLVTRVWLIRAGEGAMELDAMRHAGVIAVRYRSVGDATVLSSEQIEQALTDEGRGAAAGQLRARIQAFANGLAIGDLVVTPNTADREVWFARVTGPYQHSPEPPIEGYYHWRGVQWLGSIDRDRSLPHDRLGEIDLQPTIYELRDAGYWTGLAASTPLTNGVAALAARAARRAPAVASKQTKARVLCAGACGLTWEQTSLLDGLCPDCRS